MRNWIRNFIYKSNPISKLVYRIVYFSWLKRYKTKKDFVFTSNIEDYIPKENRLVYHSKESVFFRAPIKIDDQEPSPKLMQFYENKTFELPEGEVYVFEKAFLLGNEAVGVTINGAIISDTALDEPIVLHKCSPRLLMDFDKYPIDKTQSWCCSLVHIFSSGNYTNYFHWITDSLVLIQGVQALESKMGKKIKLIVNKNRAKYQDEYLSILGYTASDLIEWDCQKMFVENLVVVKSRRIGINRDEVLSPSAIHWLREKIIIPDLAPKFGEKIYIKREPPACRRVLNEVELYPFLEKEGFEIVDLDGLSVLDQISLFRYAKIVISPHGAGLINILYAQDMKLIELIGNMDNEKDYYWYAAYYSLSNVLKFDYAFLECDFVPVVQNQKQVKQIYDLKVDMQNLKSIYHKLCQKVD